METKDLGANLREVQDELFCKVRDEFKKMEVNMMNEIQKVKLDMMEEFKRLQDTLNLQMKITRSLKADCGRVRNQTVEVDTTNSQVLSESQQLVNSPFKGSAASPLKRRRARTVSNRRIHRTTRVKRQGNHNRCSSSKHEQRVGFTKSQKHGMLPPSPSLWWRFQITSHVLSSVTEEVLSLMGRVGINGKRPFDRGKARLLREHGKVTVEQKEKKSYESVFFIRTLRTRFFSGGGVMMELQVRLGEHQTESTWFNCYF